jgi:hypothetical protein
MWPQNQEKLHVINCSFCVSPLDTCVDYDSCTQPSVSPSPSILLSGLQLVGKFRSLSRGSLLHLTTYTGSWCCPVTSPFCSLLSVYFYGLHTISISWFQEHYQSWSIFIICQRESLRIASNAFGVSFEIRDDSKSICCTVRYEAHKMTRILNAQSKCLHSELWQFQWKVLFKG